MKFTDLKIGDFFTTMSDGFGVKQKISGLAEDNYVQVQAGSGSDDAGSLGSYCLTGKVRFIELDVNSVSRGVLDAFEEV